MVVKAVQLPFIVVDVYMPFEKNIIKGFTVNTKLCSLMLLNDDFIKAKRIDAEKKQFLE